MALVNYVTVALRTISSDNLSKMARVTCCEDIGENNHIARTDTKLFDFTGSVAQNALEKQNCTHC